MPIASGKVLKPLACADLVALAWLVLSLVLLMACGPLLVELSVAGVEAFVWYL